MLERSNIFYNTTFRKIIKEDNNIILESTSGYKIYRNNIDYVYLNNMIEVDYKSCIKILPFNMLAKLVEGYIIYIANLVRIQEGVKEFSRYDLQLLHEFIVNQIAYWHDVYKSNKTKMILYKQEFKDYSFSVDGIDIKLNSNGLIVSENGNSSSIVHAPYVITSKSNLIAMICIASWKFHKDINVVNLKNNIDNSIVSLYKNAIEDADFIKDFDDILFSPANIESIKDYTYRCNMSEKKKILRRVFCGEPTEVKLKGKGWYKLT